MAEISISKNSRTVESFPQLDSSVTQDIFVMLNACSKVASYICLYRHKTAYMTFTCRSIHRGFLVKKGVLKNFTKFPGKHLFQSHFFIEVAGLSMQLYQKRDSCTGVFL